jgi:pyruvate ferredoxin oxidoreductase gamma subunit
MAAKIYGICWHGRGGQGAKTAATMVADVALTQGKYSQGFPEYGPERMGAPMRGYTRISDAPITIHSSLESCDAVVVFDDTLLDVVDVCDTLVEGGPVIINTAKGVEEVKKSLKLKKGQRVYIIDATKIAIDEIGRPIPNVPMIGALMKVASLLPIDAFAHDIEKKFGRKFGPKVVEGNNRALQRAFAEVKVG